MFSLHNAEYVTAAYGVTLFMIAGYLLMILLRLSKVAKRTHEINQKEE